MNPVINAIHERRSIRDYKDRPVTQEELKVILDAAVASPSARNAQPWHFSVVTDNAVLTEINKEASLKIGREMDIFYNAPLVIFISGDAQNKFASIDCGIATQTIALAAFSLGLGSVILGFPEVAFSGEKKDDFKQRLQFPEGYEFAIAVAIGEPASSKEAHPVKEDAISIL